MCGLVGVAGDLAFRDEALMKKLLVFDYFRGPDSTGLATIKNDNTAKIAKLASHPINLFNTITFKDVCNGVSAKAMIGHNRLATRGNINDINAHPYQYGHIIGAHNGTLEVRDKTMLEGKLDQKFDVDSQALYASIAEFGIEETIESLHEGRDSSSGAWALTWYDLDQGTINFLRNEHRPLWYGFEKGFKRIFWGSQWEIVDNAIRQGSVSGTPTYDVWVEEETRYKYWPFDENIHYKIEVDALKQGGDERPKFKVKSLRGKEPATATIGVTGGNPFGRDNQTGHTSRPANTNSHTSTGSGTTIHSHGKSKDKRVDIFHMLGDIGSPFAGFLTEEKFNDISKFGCSWCGQTVSYQEPGLTVYDRDDMVLCAGCSGYDPKSVETATRIHVRGAILDAL